MRQPNASHADSQPGRLSQNAGRIDPSSSVTRRIVVYGSVFALGAVLASSLFMLAELQPESAHAIVRPTDAAALRTTNPFPSLDAIGQLSTLSAEELRTVDIARMNLLAARGLPGAEGLDIDKTLAQLDRWAEHARHEIDRHLYKFHANPADYENSEPYYRMLMLIVALQGDLGVHYNPARINEPDFTNSKDLFIHGMIGSDNGGTCVSMPVLYVAVGRRLGFPMKLVVTKGHVFARWDGPDHANPAWRTQLNVEGTNRGLNTPDDEYYRNWPYKLTETETTNGWFLRSLAPAEELAVFLMQRGHCLEDSGQWSEAQVAYALAHHLAPKSREAFEYLANVMRKEWLATASPERDAIVARQQANDEWLRLQRLEADEIALQAIERRRSPKSPFSRFVPDSPFGPLAPTSPLVPGNGFK